MEVVRGPVAKVHELHLLLIEALKAFDLNLGRELELCPLEASMSFDLFESRDPNLVPAASRA